MTIPLWQPSNPPSHSSDFRLAINADVTKNSPASSPPAETPADDEDNYYTAYATGLGWLPAPE